MCITHQISRPTAFVLGDVLYGPLDFSQVQGTAPQWDSVSEDGLQFGELVGVAGDEV